MSPPTTGKGLPAGNLGGFTPILVANLLPLAGIHWLGWSPATLATIYGIELLLSMCLAGAKALVAARPPNPNRDGILDVTSSELVHKRGSVRPFARLPPIYIRNVPFALAVFGGVAWVGLFLGIGLSTTFDLGTELRRSTVYVAVLALLVGQLIEIGLGYLRTGGYDSVSPYQVIETPARQAFFLVFLLVWTLGIADAIAGTAAVLGILVLGKVAVEWTAYRTAGRSEQGSIADWLSGPTSERTECEAVTVPTGEPLVRVRTDRRSVWLTAILRTITRTAPVYIPMVTVIWLVAIALVAGDGGGNLHSISIGLGLLVVLVTALVVNAAGFYLRYGTLEYRIYSEQLVAYDTLLRTPQWSAPIESCRNVSIVGDRLPDRLFGTRTIEMTMGWGKSSADRYVGPIKEPGVLVDRLRLPIVRTNHAPINRPIAAVAVGIACVLAIAAVVLLIGPGAPVTWIYGLIVIPMLSIIPRLIWWRAYPDR